MKKSTIQILNDFHHRMPNWVSRIYMPIVYLLRQMRDFWVQEYAIHGDLRGGDGSKLKLGYFGNDQRILNYWIQSLFAETTNINKRARLPVLRILPSLKLEGCSYELVLIELSGKNRFLVDETQGFLLPRWLDTILNVDNSLDALASKRNLRNIEENHFTFRESKTEEDLRFFYDKMFRPYILSRHQDASVMVDFSYFRKRMSKSGSALFFLMKDGEPQVATFNELKKNRVKFSGLGVMEGSEDILRKGAIRALYYFMLKHYQEEGIQLINFGGTSPLLSDGLTRFKRSVRAIPTDKNPYGEKSLLLVPWKESGSLQECLKLHPFIYLENGEFYKAFFPDSSVLESKKEFLQWLKQYEFLGIIGTKIYCNTRLEVINQWISEESLTNHEVLPFPSTEL